MATMAAGDEPRNATIYTVAERAGVSHQTVSRYLKGESLRPKNRDAVVAALADLDYQVNDIARALATKKAGRIGAFVFDVDDWAPQRVLAGAAEAARAEGYILDIVRLDPSDGASIDAALSMMNRTMLAGVVVISRPGRSLGHRDQRPGRRGQVDRGLADDHHLLPAAEALRRRPHPRRHEGLGSTD